MRFVGDFGATLHASTVLVGEKLGLYKALAASSGMSPADLAGKTPTAERYRREWVSAHAAAGPPAVYMKTGKGSPDPHATFFFVGERGSLPFPGWCCLPASWV